jgi:hypothetical protein
MTVRRHPKPGDGLARALSGFHATEAKMVGAGGDFAFAAGANDVARAVLVGAEEGSATMRFLLFGGLIGIEGGIRSLRIAGNGGRGR